jgi:sulfite reductase beta subunit-like hemoprotein
MNDTINWEQLSEVEKLKYESNLLRGTLLESLANPITGALADNDTHISKFHGFYQQTDRDLDKERKQQKLEPVIKHYNAIINPFVTFISIDSPDNISTFAPSKIE